MYIHICICICLCIYMYIYIYSHVYTYILHRKGEFDEYMQSHFLKVLSTLGGLSENLLVGYMCCSVLQRVAVCCSVLQCDAV